MIYLSTICRFPTLSSLQSNRINGGPVLQGFVVKYQRYAALIIFVILCVQVRSCCIFVELSVAALLHLTFSLALFRVQEDTAEYIASLKASHQREVEKIVCQHAKEHSTSKVAELKNRISTQEVRYSRYFTYI